MKITFSPLTRKICLAMAVIFFIFSAGLFYVNKILLPVQIKGMAIKAASEALNRSVTFDELQYSPLHGFMVTGLVIAEKDDPARPFLRAKYASAQVMFFALLQKKLIFPAVRIGSPEITLTRTAKDQWNFSDLLVPPAPGTPQPQAMDMIIGGFTITNGRVTLNDTSLNDNFSDTIDIPLIKGSLSLKGSFNITGSISIPGTQGSLAFDARVGTRDKSFKGTLKAKNFSAQRYLRFSPSELPVTAQNLMIADAEVTALLQGANTHVSGDISLPAFQATLADGTKVQGDITLAKVFADIKENLLTIAGDINARAMDITLSAGQTVKANITIPGLTVTQNAKGYAVSGEVKADDLSIVIAKDQALSGQALLKKMTVLLTGSAIQAQADIDIKSATASFADTSVKTEILAPNTRLTFDTGRLDTELHGVFKDLAVKTKDLTVSSTSNAPELTIRLVFDPKAEIPLSYTGTLMLAGLGISGIPTVNEIKNIRGEISFKTDSASTTGLAFSVMDTPVNVTGGISNFQAPQANINARIEKADLGLIQKFIPGIVKEQGLTVKGSAAVDVSFTGLLAKAQDAKISAIATLSDVSIESKKLNQSAGPINGLVEYRSPVLSWKDLSVKYQGKTWSSHGSMEDFVNPIVSATVEAENLTANIEAKKKDDKIQLTSLSGAWFDSTYEFIGDIFIPTGKAPNIDMNGEFKLSLRDLPKMLSPEQAKQIEALKLAGILKIKARVKGIPQDWQDLVSTASVETPALYMLGYQIADLNISAKQKDGAVNPLIITGKLYGGDLNATTTISLKEEKFPFTTGARLENTSLELLKKDTPLKQQQLSGLVNMTADLKGELLDIRKMQGTATMKISNGYLWSLEILSNVLSILSSTFQGGDIIITDADGTFKIADQKVMTDNMTLRSATVTLVGEGWVDFDQNIDMNIRPRLEPKSTDGTVNPLTLINPTDGLINIRVYNTITAPKFEHNVTAPQMIKKTIQNTVGSLLKIFE